MASFNLSWTAAGGLNSAAQEVQYREASSSTWLVATTLSASANSYTVTGLTDNVIYDFRIVNMCAYGGPAPGTPFQIVSIVCPTVNTTPTHNSVAFNFLHLGGSVTEYRVDLLNAAGNTVLAFKTITSPSSTVSDSFTGLSATTSYNLRVTCKAESHTKVCPLVAFTTTVVPTCNIPAGLVVSIS